MIATIGVDNLVVVETEDAVLVCSKDRVQDVKKVVDTLQEHGQNGIAVKEYAKAARGE